MTRFFAFFASLAEESGEGAKDTADEEPESVGLSGVAEDFFYEDGKNDDAGDTAEGYGQEEEEVFFEIALDVCKEGDDFFVDTEDGGEGATADAGENETRTDEDTFEEAKKPVYGGFCWGRWRSCHSDDYTYVDAKLLYIS